MAKIFVIAGHGAGDPGAVGNGFTEAERVRALAARIKALGGDNVTVGDTSRDWYADNGISSLNISKDTQIIELHMDSAGPTARGGHVIIKAGFKADKYDNALANMLANILPGRSQMIVGRDDLANPNRAAIKGYSYRLVEFGFITNAADMNVFNTRMDDIARGVLNAFGITATGGGSTSGGNTNTGGNTGASKPSTPTTDSSEPVFTYAARAGGKVYPEVRNLSDYAGSRGTAITDVAIKVSKGSVKYRVHVKGGNWLPWVTGYNWNDHNNGYAGNGQAIDAIQVYYTTPADFAKTHGYRKAQYRVSPVNGNYYSWQYDDETGNGQDGYAGAFGVAIDRFQLY